MYITVSQLYHWKVVQLTMKLFIIVVVSVIVCCNAQDKPLNKAVQLLEAILDETKAARELQNELLEDIRNETWATRELLDNILKETRTATELQENTLNEVESAVAKLENVSNEVHSVRQEAEDYRRLSQPWYTQPNVFVSFASCEDIKTMSPSAPSGYYNITKYDGTIQQVYCNLEHFCGSIGWTRVAYLDMSDLSQGCPAELRLYRRSGVRACGRQTSSSGSCDSVTFSTNGISYSQVCGRVIGYQYGHPDATHRSVSIDSYYVEGISITHGSPRQHIWTLAAGRDETGTDNSRCPCNTGSTDSVPSFVGDDYFCESGTSSNPSSPWQLYSDDPLWDGKGCGGNEGPCCIRNTPGMPWFHKVLNSHTTDDIEMRVCADYSTTEDAPVSLYELYVK